MGENAVRAERDWPQVVVAGGYQTGVQLARSLTRRGLQVTIVDHNPVQPCFRSIYCKGIRCPNPDEKPAEWLKFMQDLAGTFSKKPVLMTSADQFVQAIFDHAAALSPLYTFCDSKMDLQMLLATKEKQYEIAPGHGMPVPVTETVHSLEETMDFAARARFPCILKPIHFREWQFFPAGHPLLGKKLVPVATPDALREQYNLAAGLTPVMVVQEEIEGPDTAKVVYLSCYSKTGERIGHCTVQEVRTCPIHFGSASVVESVEDPEVSEICDGFLRSLGYVGLCEIELKRDSRDGKVKMIEANPRYSVTADAAPYAGVDLGWLHYLDLTGQPVTPVHGDGTDYRHIFMFLDASTVANYRREGLLTLGQLLRSYRRPVHFFDFDWRDWKVALNTLKLSFKALVGPTVRRFIPRR